MEPDARLAALALNLVEGTVEHRAAADDLLVEGFADLDEAARGHAYLSGFLLTMLADARGTTVRAACAEVRALLRRG